MTPHILSWADVDAAATKAHERINGMLTHNPHTVLLYGVPRGGIHAAQAIAQQMISYGERALVTDNHESAHVIVDDLLDSGATFKRWKALYPTKPFVVLYDKPMMQKLSGSGERPWLVFPWEAEDPTKPKASADDSGHDVFTRLLQYVGEDANREGLLETPGRAAKAWRFWTRGYAQSPEDVLKVFEDGAGSYDEMVLVRDIPVYSHCEHHLAPIFGKAHVAYIPNGRIVGLSKLNRLVDVFARRLQVQERLTVQIADALNKHLQPKGVAVALSCRHMCMESRGVCQQGTSTFTSALRGAFLEQGPARAEFMAAIRANGSGA